MRYKKTVIINADASSKNGYSCWCYKIYGSKSCSVGFVKTMNIAAVEILAIIKAVKRFDKTEPIIVFSDALIAVNLINAPENFSTTSLITSKDKLFLKYRFQLLAETAERKGKLQAIWINSRNNHPDHLDVDSTARNMLNEFLKGVR